MAESEVKIGWNDAAVRAKSQSHYFSPNSNVSLEIGNFGAPCPPSSTRSAHTHAHTGSQMQLFHHFFPPLSPSLQLRLIVTDLRLKEETRIHIRNVSFKERAKPRQLVCASLPPPQTLRCFLEEKFNLFQPGRLKAAHFQSAQLAPGCIFFMHKSSKRKEEAFRKGWTFTVAVVREGKRTGQQSWGILLKATLMNAFGSWWKDEFEKTLEF